MGHVQKTNNNSLPFGILEKVFVGCLLIIFAGVVLHAPFSVGFGVLFPDYSLVIKSWKEILLGIGLVLGIVIATKHKAWQRFNTPLFWLIGGFAALNLALIPFFYGGVEQTIAGLLINLRFFLFFVLVYGAIKLYPHLYRPFIKVFIAGAVVVIGFALLQLTVLPHDFLKYLGYSTATIAPFLTVDENMDYIRISSTLRGPNPLGAYTLIVIAVLLTLWLRSKRVLEKRELWFILVLGFASAVTLWMTYSRSAALGALAAVAIIMLVIYGRRLNKWIWISVAVGCLAIGGGALALRDTQFVSQVILHEDPEEGNDVNSNDGHAESLVEGTTRAISQPVGAGIGSTGSASLLGDKPFIVENQYLFVAHETGWLGIILFVIIYWFVLRQLWRKRSHWFALGVFASGIGLAIIGMLLPVFVDDTVSIIWWGLAAIALASSSESILKPLKKSLKKTGKKL